jgi:hypothetical protein
VFNVSIIICLVKETKNRIKLQQMKFFRQNSSVSKSLLRDDLSQNILITSLSLIPLSVADKDNKRESRQILTSNRFTSFISTMSNDEPKSMILMRRRHAIVELSAKKIIAKLLSSLKREKKDSQVRVVVTILLVNISFIILTTPLAILQIINQIRYNNAIKFKKAYSDEEDFETTKSLFELFQYINHSINFFLYCLGGQTFRTETKKLFNEIYFSIFKGR